MSNIICICVVVLPCLQRPILSLGKGEGGRGEGRRYFPFLDDRWDMSCNYSNFIAYVTKFTPSALLYFTNN